METFFISRHQGAKMWLAQQGIVVDTLLDHLDLAQVREHDRVIGTLPVQLVAQLNERGVTYCHLTLDLTAELRGKELSAAEMVACGARLDIFQAVKLGKCTE